MGIPVAREAIVVKTGTVQNMCSERHISVLGASFCSECGRKASLTDEEDFTPEFKALCELNGTAAKAGYETLRDTGWSVSVGEREEGDDNDTTYRVELGSLSVETPYEPGSQEVVGFRILVAELRLIGEGTYTSSVMEIPVEGFPLEASIVTEVAKLLGSGGAPKIYPQVSLG